MYVAGLLNRSADAVVGVATHSLMGGVWYSAPKDHSEGVFVHTRKPKPIPLPEFVPWTAAHFQSEESRDQFLVVAATLSARDVEAGPMCNEARGALVRWRPGKFLGLNDVVYAHGGRIVVSSRGSHPEF